MPVHQHFDPELESVARARHLVVEALAQVPVGRDRDLLDVVQLLTSELVSNAVLHAGTDFEVDLDVEDVDGEPVVVVGVSDRSTRRPVLRVPSVDTPGGRGVFLVDQLSTEWGVDARGAGKRVWCRITPAPVRSGVRIGALGGV